LTTELLVTGNTSTYTDNGSDQVINYQVRDAKGCTVAEASAKAKRTPTDLTFSNAAITNATTSTTVTATATVV
jgi:hypothetical protein